MINGSESYDDTQNSQISIRKKLIIKIYIHNVFYVRTFCENEKLE